MFETEKAEVGRAWVELNTEEFCVTYSSEGHKAEKDVMIWHEVRIIDLDIHKKNHSNSVTR
jgi:hypothetical protein